MIPLETRLIDALAADVARFDSLGEQPAAESEADELLQLRPLSPPSVGRGRRALASVAAVALVGTGVAAFAALRGDDDTLVSNANSAGSPDATSVMTPPGIEQPLVETAITDAHTMSQVTKPGSVHAFSMQGHPDLLLWTGLTVDFTTGDVGEWQCVDEQGSSGCGSVAFPAQFSQTSSIDNGVASDDLFTWNNLPPEVDTVRYDDGSVQLWQRPIAGLSVFRVNPDRPHPSIRAHDARGATLPYSFWSTNPTTTPTGTTPNVPPLDGEIWGELSTLAQSSVHECLTLEGATWALPNIPSFDPSVDALAMWDDCVPKVRAVVSARKAELFQSN